MFLALLAALISPAPATPTETLLPPPPAVDPGRMSEAMGLLDEEGFEEQILRSTEVTMDLMVATMASQIQKRSEKPVPEDLLQQLGQAMREHAFATLRIHMSEIKQHAATIYAQEFTREELVRLRELSRDPVMVKSRERGKVIGPKMMALGVRVMRARESELEEKIERLVSDFVESQDKGDDRS